MLTIYDAERGEYIKDFLPDGTCADTPEEVGGVLVLRKTEDGYSIDLKDAGTDETIASRTSATEEFACEWAAEKWNAYVTTHDVKISMAKKSCGNGEKLAIKKGDRYYFASEITAGSIIPDELRAEKVEEIFAFADLDKEKLIRPDGTEYQRSDYYSDEFAGESAWLSFGIETIRYCERMKELASVEEFGGGFRIAAVTEDQRYSLDFLEHNCRAESPSEAGLIAEYTWSEEDMVGIYAARTVIGAGKVLDVKLTECSTGRLFAERRFKSSAPGTVRPTETTFEGIFNKDAVFAWMEEQCKYYYPNWLMSQKFDEQGNGAKFVMFETDREWYSNERLSENLWAETTGDIRGIIKITGSYRNTHGWYSVNKSPTKLIYGSSETIDIQILDRDGNAVLAKGKIDAGSPEKISGDEYASENYTHMVTNKEIENWIIRHS